MADSQIQKYVNSLEKFIEKSGITADVVNAYSEIAGESLKDKSDLQYGLQTSTRAKEVIEQFTIQKMDMDLWELEKFSFAHKTWYEILDKNYGLLKLEAQNKILDSYLLYLEKKREPRERFYMPKRKQFHKFGLIEAYQGLIDDVYDIACISMPPGTGKTTLLKFFNSAVAGWFPEDYSLFYSHSGDITRMYYDGVYQMVSNELEYSWNDIFPDLKITSTNAKMQQFNVGKYKPFPSVQTASIGSENAGKVRASKFLLIDDMIGKLEEALNKNTLDKLWGAYTVDARQRKTMDYDGRPCKEIINATRWSTKDVIGRVIEMYEGNQRVIVIAMPDIDAQTGKSNFDYEYGGFTVEFFNDQAHLMDDVSYKCLFKQEPVEREGLLFPDNKIQRYKEEELRGRKIKRITGQCDCKGKGTDYFVLPCLVEFEDAEGIFYCVDTICSNSADYELQYEDAANIIVNNEMNDCEFESNAGGDRVAMEVNKRVEAKGWVCNISDKATETNKEARIFQYSNWIMQHIRFKDKSLYTAKEHYGVMMAMLLSYSVSGKNKNDDVADVFSNFAVRMKRGSSGATAQAVQNPYRTGGYGGYGGYGYYGY